METREINGEVLEVLRIDMSEPQDFRHDGRMCIIVTGNPDRGFFHAPNSHLVIENDFSLSSLTAASIEAKGHLYPFFGINVAGDVIMPGFELTTEASSPSSIGGNLVAGSLDSSRGIDIGGNVTCRDYISVMRWTVGGSVECPNIHGPDPDAPDGPMM